MQKKSWLKKLYMPQWNDCRKNLPCKCYKRICVNNSNAAKHKKKTMGLVKWRHQLEEEKKIRAHRSNLANTNVCSFFFFAKISQSECSTNIFQTMKIASSKIIASQVWHFEKTR